MSINISQMNEMLVVQWNSRQRQFQIRALGEILKSNLLAAVNGQNSGYVPVAIAHTKVEALEISKLIEANLKNGRAHPGDSLDTLD